MLDIKIHVSTIDYSATFHTLYPLLAGHFTKADEKNLLKSLIIALGDDAEKVFVSWLPYLEETERRKLIAGIVSQNSPRLTALLNEKLQSFEIGKSINNAILMGNKKMPEDDGLDLVHMSGIRITL